jgi:glutamyl-tRNA reductase
MNIFCIGINHRTAPVELREKLWFSDAQVRATLADLKAKYAAECVLTSTCNRTELYFVPKNETLNGAPPWHVLAAYKQALDAVHEENFYFLPSLHAARHLFGVVSGIDSMVIGDVQILNQVKEAFQAAQESHTTGILLNRLFTTALHVGKRARTETEVGEGAVSISYAAAELASKIFEDLSKRTALLIGAGETGKLTAKHLCSRNLGHLLLANRTRSRAEGLAQELGGSVIDFEAFAQQLSGVDIIITAVDTDRYILHADQLRQAMKQRGNRPLFVIDIGVPRNVDPSAEKVDNVFLHDIDALNQIIDINVAHRRDEVRKVEVIMYDELVTFQSWFESLQVAPTIQLLRDQFESIRQAEVDKHLKHFTSEQREDLDMLTRRIINKILHTPLVNLKNGSAEHDQEETRHKLHLLRHLFGLDKSAK